jgi:RNA polymerase sigma-70 factor, ECF subfamily
MHSSLPQETQQERTARFMRLYAQHERRIFVYVLSLVCNLDDTNEIVQETCVRMWEQFDDFAANGDFGSWACSIAYYQVLSMRKKLRTSKVEFGLDFYEAVAMEVAASVEGLDERQQALNNCLEKLRPQHRDFLRLCYSGQAQFKTIAGRLGRSLSATYSLLFRIRRLSQDCVQKSLPEASN